jgi:hypothetical protein
MFHLIKKDFLIQKKNIILSIFVIVFFFISFPKINDISLMVSVFAITYMLTLGSCAVDEKNNSDKLLSSLPITKEKLILSKYLSVLVFAAYAVLINVVIYTTIKILNLPVNLMSISFNGLISSIIGSILYGSISLPLIFKLGYLKSRMVNLLLFFAIMFGGTAIIDKMVNKNDLSHIVLNQSYLILTIIIIFISVIIFIVSYNISLYFYKNREF